MPDRTHPHPLVAVMAANQPLVHNLLNVHTADADGRCAGCALDARLRPVWPCGPHGIAVLAYQLAQQRKAS
jgi:hypothetical protein